VNDAETSSSDIRLFLYIKSAFVGAMIEKFTSDFISSLKNEDQILKQFFPCFPVILKAISLSTAQMNYYILQLSSERDI
jgi:hypothetical protein